MIFCSSKEVILVQFSGGLIDQVGQVSDIRRSYRFVVSCGQLIGDRSLSNHCPIYIKLNKLDWAPNCLSFFQLGCNTHIFYPLSNIVGCLPMFKGKRVYI